MAEANLTTRRINSIPELTPIQIAHFWGKVKFETDFQCWAWMGAKNSAGYGRIVVDRVLLPAHRVAYTLINGPIQDGSIIRHKCDNPECCNPRHLETGTDQDNSNDAVSRGRTAHGKRNSRTKLTAEQITYIRTNPDKLLQKDFAKMYGMATSSISYIANRRSWKYEEA